MYQRHATLAAFGLKILLCRRAVEKRARDLLQARWRLREKMLVPRTISATSNRRFWSKARETVVGKENIASAVGNYGLQYDLGRIICHLRKF